MDQKKEERKVHCLPLDTPSNRIYLKASVHSDGALHIIIVTGSSTVPRWDMNPGPHSLEAREIISFYHKLKSKIFVSV